MRFHLILDHIFGKKTNIKVLRFFALHAKEASVRGIAREIKVSPPNVAKSLEDLKKEGVLSVKKIGRSLVYTLNTENEFIKSAILPLFLKEKKTTEKLAEVILPSIKFSFEALVLFGSMARGDENPKSDIDLAVILGVHEDKQSALDQLLRISQVTSRKFGNPLSPVVYTAKEFSAGYKKNVPLFREIYKEGKVLAGKSLNEMIIGSLPK